MPNKDLSDDRPSFTFTDATTKIGVRATYENDERSEHRSIVESLGGGVGWLDYDSDGAGDLIFPGGGELRKAAPSIGLPTTLWRQIKDGRYQNVTLVAEFPSPITYTHGVSVADYNNDGYADVLISGYGGLQLLRNQGDGTFSDVTADVGIEDRMWSSSTGFGDINGDGAPDIYVTHYVNWSWDNHPTCPASNGNGIDICSPNDFDPLPDLVYLGDGRGGFSSVSGEIGLADDGKGLGVMLLDVDQDQDLDIYVANDTRNNFLYLNDGSGQLSEVGLLSGTAVDAGGTPNGSMGLAAFDFDNDLLADIWVTNYENETCALYQNVGEGNFLWATERTGINALGTLFVSFGTVAGDFDLDGDEDLAVSNGHIMLHPRQGGLSQLPLLLENTLRGAGDETGAARFLRQSASEKSGYFETLHRGRGVITGDFDRDGDLDLVFSHTNEPATVLLNDSGRKGRLFEITLIGRQSNRDAIGATAILQTNRGKYLRQVIGGGSYLSQNPYTLTWGIPGAEEIESLSIYWPSGQRQLLSMDELAGRTMVVEPNATQ